MSLRLSGGRRLQSPPGDLARPTPARVRLAVINLLAAELPGCRWLDLCSGSGAMACEALQRGAGRVVAVERDRRLAAVTRSNLEAVQQGLGRPSQVQVHATDVLRWLRRGRDAGGNAAGSSGAGGRADDDDQGGFDLIYADPPYAAGLYGPIAEAVAGDHWLAERGTMIWECGSGAVAEPPPGWRLRDRRRYGSTSVVLLQQG
ncbi:MAG: 16S rRNA (guanine(966)-N(2))-methyltransferase RsmD [Cyanobium sp. PLM2.Bin73]|nr:MAG: 16S rRNA (guanine(966)-N(2))-methyltransferase RsmD [Cyanobium sp. PLM2.Bin73]